MTFLRASLDSVQRNLPSVSFYVAAATLLHLVFMAGSLAVEGDLRPGDIAPMPVQLYALTASLVFSVILAAVQAVAFARMGREIDRPLWRSPNAADALRRFFQLWLILNLTGVALDQLTNLAGRQGADGATLSLVMLNLLVFVLSVPVGACIMFSGAFEWKELGSSLAPLVRQAPRTLMLLVLNCVQLLLLFQIMALRAPGTVEPAVLWTANFIAAIASACIDCFVFAGTWHLCIEDRNADQDIDFDF